MNAKSIVKAASLCVKKHTPTVLKKYAPEIMAVGGTVLVVAGTALSCKATIKAKEVVESSTKELELITDLDHEDYSEEDRKNDKVIVYTKCATEVVKEYIIPAGVLALGLTTMLVSNNILRKRGLAIAAAYSALDAGFRKYRGAVAEKFGEEVDRELLYGLTREKISEEIFDEETGKSKKVKKEVLSLPEGNELYSPYARVFDDSCPDWSTSNEYNMMFLQCQQRNANDLLKARGHIMLNEVYDMLGFDRTKAGAVVGWKLGNGDDEVDFGIFDVKRKPVRDFVNGHEDCIILDFNVDGVIWNLI